MPYAEKLSTYQRDHFDDIRGWVDPDIFDALIGVQRIQNEFSIHGDIAEIGVHHGKFFFALACLAGTNEKSVAVDLFDQQDLNIDKSGKAAHTIFQKHYSKIASLRNVITIKEDSLVLSPQRLLSETRSEGFRIVSIDGGHTILHTFNDLLLTSRILVNGAVAFVDDYYNSNWPGVHQGFIRFMTYRNANLAPFAYHARKLMLTTYSYHHLYLDRYSRYLEDELNAEYKTVNLVGHEMITVRDDRVCPCRYVLDSFSLE